LTSNERWREGKRDCSSLDGEVERDGEEEEAEGDRTAEERKAEEGWEWARDAAEDAVS